MINKPWGREHIIEQNEFYVVKRLEMFKGHACSLQYHKKKHETITVIKGSLKIYYGPDKDNLNIIYKREGESFVIPPGMVHRMEAVSEDIVYIEASTNHLDDIVRLEDNYGRVDK